MKKEKMVTRTFEEMMVTVLVVNTNERKTYEDTLILDACEDNQILDNAKEYMQDFLKKNDCIPVTVLEVERYSVKYAISESKFKLYGTAVN